MAHYTLEGLLEIYARVYQHEVQTLIRDGDDREHHDLIMDLAEFGNQIARMPNDEHTQETARDYARYLDDVHRNTIVELEAGVWNHPCECMREVIDDRVEILERMVDELREDDDSDRGTAIWIVYDRWSEHKYRIHARY